VVREGRNSGRIPGAREVTLKSAKKQLLWAKTALARMRPSRPQPLEALAQVEGDRVAFSLRSSTVYPTP